MRLGKVRRSLSADAPTRDHAAVSESERFRLAVAVAIGSLVLGLVGLILDQFNGVVGIIGLVLIVFAVLGVWEAVAIYRGYFTPSESEPGKIRRRRRS